MAGDRVARGVEETMFFGRKTPNPDRIPYIVTFI
jgi:hypothetical protein